MAIGRPVVPESAAYKLVEIEGKGRGLVATRNPQAARSAAAKTELRDYVAELRNHVSLAA